IGSLYRNMWLNCSVPFTGSSLFELRMFMQLFPRLRRESRLAINRLVQRFGAGGAVGALQPFPVERLVNQLKRVGGDGGFLLLAGRAASANVETSEQQRHARHRAAGVGRQRARPRRAEQAKQIREQRQRPHSWIIRRRERVEQNRIRSGQRGGSGSGE